ncbi:MAG: nuclear transport factor 2 family protein, partial [Novosphingobium sp.]
ELIHGYGPLVDAGDSAGAAALWSPDGCYDVGGHGVYTGRAAIAALLDGDEHRSLVAGGVAHVLSAPVITLDGDGATALTYSLVLRRDGAKWEAHRVAANRWRLVRTHEGWRVAERVNRLLDGDADALALLACIGFQG